MSNPRFTLRPIQDTPEDLTILRDLIMELAIYEKSPESAKATPELLRTNIFERKHANAVFAVVRQFPCSPRLLLCSAYIQHLKDSTNQQVVAFALYFFTFSTWTGRPGLYLEDLFVKESHRSFGIGKALFAHLGKIAAEEGCPRLDWVVLDWNEVSIHVAVSSLSADTAYEPPACHQVLQEHRSAGEVRMERHETGGSSTEGFGAPGIEASCLRNKRRNTQGH